MNIKIRKTKLCHILKIFFPTVKMDEMWCTFGKWIYMPKNTGITADLVAHEMVHVKQQKNWFIAIFWWIRYIVSAKFRYSQELPAYQEQYNILKRIYKDKNSAFRIKMSVARAMSENYKMVSYDKAVRDLQ